MSWVGPFKISELLEDCIAKRLPSIPYENSIYLISDEIWTNEPDNKCKPLYVGSNSTNPKRFKQRLGELIADLFGFFDDRTGMKKKGHHSGGQSLFIYCQKMNIYPGNLYIGWKENCICSNCSELEYFSKLSPKWNKKSPPKCAKHIE